MSERSKIQILSFYAWESLRPSETYHKIFFNSVNHTDKSRIDISFVVISICICLKRQPARLPGKNVINCQGRFFTPGASQTMINPVSKISPPPGGRQQHKQTNKWKKKQNRVSYLAWHVQQTGKEAEKEEENKQESKVDRCDYININKLVLSFLSQLKLPSIFPTFEKTVMRKIRKAPVRCMSHVFQHSKKTKGSNVSEDTK